MAPRDHDALDEPGRQIHLVPLAPGLWSVLLGCGTMALGPLFGFLAGSMLGTNRMVWGMSPIYFFLFVGFLVAGIGLGVVLLGARRLLMDHREAESREQQISSTPAR